MICPLLKGLIQYVRTDAFTQMRYADKEDVGDCKEHEKVYFA